jgi:hypothetical protein
MKKRQGKKMWLRSMELADSAINAHTRGDTATAKRLDVKSDKLYRKSYPVQLTHFVGKKPSRKGGASTWFKKKTKWKLN